MRYNAAYFLHRGIVKKFQAFTFMCYFFVDLSLRSPGYNFRPVLAGFVVDRHWSWFPFEFFDFPVSFSFHQYVILIHSSITSNTLSWKMAVSLNDISVSELRIVCQEKKCWCAFGFNSFFFSQLRTTYGWTHWRQFSHFCIRLASRYSERYFNSSYEITSFIIVNWININKFNPFTPNDL
jgi:hypothetical protein